MSLPYCDAHLHLTSLPDNAPAALKKCSDSMLCSSVFTPGEWKKLCEIEALLKNDETAGGIRILKAFGIHPQNPDMEMLAVLEKLLSEGTAAAENSCERAACAPDAIGEAGYDFFTKVFEAQEKQQNEVWYAQIELAEKYRKPLVVHLRHAVDRMFRDAGLLKNLPSVIFHSFPGSPLEAEAIRKRGINAFFSFGKPILNNRRNSIECVRKLPLEWLLFETDAPYQTLKGESATEIGDIERVYRTASNIRSMSDNSAAFCGEDADDALEKLAANATVNFKKAFLLD